MKKLLSFSFLLILLGGIIFTMTACSGSENLARFLSNTVVNTTEVAESFDKIDILCDTADVSISIAEDGVRKVVAVDQKNIKAVGKVGSVR